MVVALIVLLTVSVVLVSAVMLVVTAHYTYAAMALALFVLGCVLFIRLAPRMDKWVAQHRTKAPPPERLQVTLFGAVCLVLGVWLSYVVFNGVSEGELNILSKRPVFSQIVLDAHQQPIAFWFNVAYGLFLILAVLYGPIWCIRRWRQLSNPTVERDARKSGARSSP